VVPDAALQIWLPSYHCWQDTSLVLLAGGGIKVCGQEAHVHLTDGLREHKGVRVSFPHAHTICLF